MYLICFLCDALFTLPVGFLIVGGYCLCYAVAFLEVSAYVGFCLVFDVWLLVGVSDYLQLLLCLLSLVVLVTLIRVWFVCVACNAVLRLI